MKWQGESVTLRRIVGSGQAKGVVLAQELPLILMAHKGAPNGARSNMNVRRAFMVKSSVWISHVMVASV